MDDYKIYRMAAFGYKHGGGNLAGVVLDADNYTDDEMKSIAKEVGYSETAFVMKSDIADFKVQFFTPVDEVDLCGHATIATFNLLRDLGVVKVGFYTQEIKAGVLSVEIKEDSVFMEQTLPYFTDSISKDEVLECFDLDTDDFIEGMPFQVVSTGLRDIIIPINGVEKLTNMTPNFEKLKALSRKYNAVGIHAFTLESVDKGSAHTRNFAPSFGIDEEAATGSASGALACYLWKYATEKGSSNNYEFEQGYSMGLPSRIYVNLSEDNKKINKVSVGGGARAV